MKKGIALLGVCVFAAAAIAGPFSRRGSPCGPGGCNVPSVQLERTAAAPSIDWRSRPDRPEEIALYRHGIQVGSWDYSSACWRDYNAARDEWGPASLIPPVPPPARAQPTITVKRIMAMADEDEQPDPEPKDLKADLKHPDNHGIDWSQINDHQATYSGRKISCSAAIELIGKQVPDDSKKFRLTVIGTDAEQKEALKQWSAIEPAVRDRCNAWAVTADHWSLKDTVTGQTVFKTDGSPVVYFQSPEGKVLHRQDNAVGMIESVRKAVKGYDSSKDPDLRKQAAKPATPTDNSIHPAIPVCCLLGGAGLLLYLKGK
jgi:hypothetical protein